MGSEDEGFEDTDLHVAVRLGDLKATEEALKSGCNPDEIGLFDWSALHEAAYNGDIEIIKLLLEFGADPNKTDNLNCNTAVHYACIEKQAECLELFLTKGGDPSIKNKDGKTSIDLTEDTACRKVFSDRGFDIKPKEKPLKSILKDPVYKKSATQKLKTLPRPQISKQAPSTPPRPSRPSNHVFVDASSPASSDSGRHSPERRLFSSSKEAWDEKDLLSIPGSPARSQGSSYGSLLSLGSSSCSGADDNAGEFVMSFQYNSKTKQFKVRIWEVLITSLLSTAKIAKDTSLQLYLKTTIVPDQEYQPNPALRRKSEVFRLNPSENNEPVSENQSTDMFVWKGKEARLEFKNSLTLVYEDISKELVATSSLDISISVKRKKSFMTSKHKQQLQDPVLASVNLYMKEAVRKLMKDKYETQRHDIPGITRQAFSLDSVVTDNMRRRNGIETSSAPLERIRLRSLEGVKQTAVNNRCASDGDVHEIPGKNLRKSTQSVTSDVSSNVWLEDPVTESSSLESVTSHVTTPSPQVEVKISSQLTYNEPSFQMQMPKPEKTKDALHEKTHRGRNLIQKSRQKIRSTGHGLIPSSMKSSVTVVTAMDEEERSVGSPSYISNLANRQHSYSTGSLVEVDESPSPSRYRRQNRFASTPDKRRYKPEHYKSSEKLGSRSIAVQMDPKDKNVSISMEKLAPRAEMKHSYGTSYNRRKTSETSCGSRPSILRKLVYDETTFVPNEMNNPCFVND